MTEEVKKNYMTLVSVTDDEIVRMEAPMMTLLDTLFAMERFLRASGFVFDGSLSISSHGEEVMYVGGTD